VLAELASSIYVFTPVLKSEAQNNKNRSFFYQEKLLNDPFSPPMMKCYETIMQKNRYLSVCLSLHHAARPDSAAFSGGFSLFLLPVVCWSAADAVSRSYIRVSLIQILAANSRFLGLKLLVSSAAQIKCLMEKFLFDPDSLPK